MICIYMPWVAELLDKWNRCYLHVDTNNWTGHKNECPLLKQIALEILMLKNPGQAALKF